jgi:putative ABC transport system ATP-binding protein
MTTAILVATDLHRSITTGSRSIEILRGVDLIVAPGEWVAVMGASGSGKSTLLHLLGGLDLPDSGTITIRDRRVDGTTETERARLRRTEVGYVFQSYNLLAELTALGNVALPLRLAGRSRRQATERAAALLAELGLADQADQNVTELSGGEQQRVALARAIALEPTLLLADEPTGALDTEAGAAVMRLLAARHDAGQAIVMVTHDHRVAAQADRMLVLSDGRFVEEHTLTEPESTSYSNLISLEAT